MAISFQVLGNPGRDNFVLARVDSGHQIDRLLFDCGAGGLDGLSVAERQAIDHVFLSHLHMDHIAGFDSFFRVNYDRTSKPNIMWGPQGTSRILQHRFCGYLWNITEQMVASWHVQDVYPDRVESFCFQLSEAFEKPHPQGTRFWQGAVHQTSHYSVEVLHMDHHHTPSLAYIVREQPHQNIDSNQLAKLGLAPGAWLQSVKSPPLQAAGRMDDLSIDVTTTEGRKQTRQLSELREELVVESTGDSLAYLTDFRLEKADQDRLVPALRGVRWMVCESQYLNRDADLARKNYHMTVGQVAETAARAEVEELILIHISDRYTTSECHLLLQEARSVFPATRFPDHWDI